MLLNVLDRLLILNLDTLPQSGSIITLKIKKELLSAVSFSEEDIKTYGLVAENGTVGCNDWGLEEEIPIGKQGLKLLIEAMDKSQNLSDKYISLYDKLKVQDGITE